MASKHQTQRGKFIVFEGLDGSGTSTQARLLQEALINDGREAFLTSEPTHGPVGNLIKLAMTHRLFFSKNIDNDDKQLAYLFAADRFDHLYNSLNGVFEHLDKGAMVSSTRYFLSSFAYHCNDDDDVELVRRLNKDFPPADITFFIDCPPDICIQRINSTRAVPEKYENLVKLESVRKNYLNAIDEYEKTALIYTLDGTQSQSSLHDEILQKLKDVL